MPAGLRFYQWLMDTERERRFANQDRLRALKHDADAKVTIFCSHDEKELEAMQRLGTPTRPAGARQASGTPFGLGAERPA